MAPPPPLLLTFLVATASANTTTSYFLPNYNIGTSHLRFVASVVNASSDIVTLVARFADDPLHSAPFGYPSTVDFGTLTLGPTHFEVYSTHVLGRARTDTSYALESAYSLKCDKQTDASTADCTASVGPGIAIQSCVAANYESRPTSYRTQLWTFSDTDTAGVDTIVRTIPGGRTGSMPEWCGSAMRMSDIEVPSSALVNTLKPSASSFGVYTFVITAGAEKLPTATTGGAAGTGGVAPTGEGSQGFAPAKTVAPALAGLGAAVAVFL